LQQALFVFLHVVLAFIGISLWCAGLAVVYIMYKSGRFDLSSLSTASLVSGGILLIAMQIFASIAYAVYVRDVEPILGKSFTYMIPLFNLKILISSIASLIGILAVALVWSPSSRSEVKLSLTLISLVITLFLVDLILAAWVMTTVSV